MPRRNVGGCILLPGQEGAITSAQATLHALSSQAVSLCLGGDISLSMQLILMFSHPSAQANELHEAQVQPAQKQRTTAPMVAILQGETKPSTFHTQARGISLSASFQSKYPSNLQLFSDSLALIQGYIYIQVFRAVMQHISIS